MLFGTIEYSLVLGKMFGAMCHIHIGQDNAQSNVEISFS